MNSALLIATLITSSTLGQTISKETVEQQNRSFQRWWAADFQWQFDKLPLKASVGEDRRPYSGYIYPDTGGGTMSALYKYDRAFNRGTPATAYERRDTSITEPTTQMVRRGFGLFRSFATMETVYRVPHWYGHCNGWTAATIRHAEPQYSVRRNGVLFSPADIKALLAEIYIYNDHEVLADKEPISPGTLHAVIANWIGLGKHPLGIEADPGKEKWNYPSYEYEVNAYNRTSRGVDIELRLTYAMNSQGEYQRSPLIPYIKYFNYHLNLGPDNRIVGGYYYYSSAQIDMLWVPLSPKDPGKEGNERGNPYVNIDTVLAIWRDSVTEDVRDKWAVVDPFRPGQGPAPTAPLNPDARPDAIVDATPEPASESLATAEEPAAPVPATEVPATEVPAVEVPAVELATAEEPVAEEPAAEVAAREEPAAEEVATVEAPAAEEPAAEVAAAEEPPTEVPPTGALAASPAADADNEANPSDSVAPEPQPAVNSLAEANSPGTNPTEPEPESAPVTDAAPAAETPSSSEPTPSAPTPESTPSPPDELLAMRRWIDDTGTYAVEARLIAIMEEEAWFIKSDGRTCRALLTRLSDDDQEIVAQARERYGTGRIAS